MQSADSHWNMQPNKPKALMLAKRQVSELVVLGETVPPLPKARPKNTLPPGAIAARGPAKILFG